MLRYRFNHIKASVILDTLPKVMELSFPELKDRWTVDKTDWYMKLPNGSEIWFGGLDDKERTEKILGQEYATIYFNECSQIPWASRNMAITRLAQNTPLRLKAFYDCVSGDTVLDGHTETIENLALVGKPIKVLTTHGVRQASAPWMSGISRMYVVKTNRGKSLRVTSSHQFWTPEGWRQLSDISIGQRILCIGQGQSRGDVQDGQPLTETQKGYQGNCCKYPRQHGEQSHCDGDGDLVCLASSSDEEQHIQFPFHHGGLGSHMGHPYQPEVQHIHHSQEYQIHPLQSSDVSHAGIERLSGLLAYGLSQQRRQSVPQFDLVGCPASQASEVLPASLLAELPSLYSEAVGDDDAIYRQWQRYNQSEWQSLGQTALGSINSSVDLLACDTPLMDGCVFETVVDIEPSAAIASYTVEVPFTNHYVANGIVSHNCNPPGMAHWTYQLFVNKRDPDRKQPVPNPGNFASLLMNPKDNEENLSALYLEELANMSEAMRRRFLLGQFADMSESALWSLELLDQQRITNGVVPDMARIVIAVDPSGVAGEEDTRSDEIGIVVCGLGKDGRGYILEDLSGRMAPAMWGKAIISAFDRWEADAVVAETNFGGAMVAEIVRSAAADKDRKIGGTVPVREVKASRGKIARAEPISALFEQEKISLVGHFMELEDQLCAMTTAGYIGSRSPDRADAAIWGLASLFPAMTKQDSNMRRGGNPVVNLSYPKMRRQR